MKPKMTMAGTRNAKLSALSRGKAISRAPIISGTMKLPNGPIKNVIVVRIISMPCIVTIVLYA